MSSITNCQEEIFGAGREELAGRRFGRPCIKRGRWKDMRNRKNRIFSWRVKGSLIIVAALIIGSLILAFALYGAEPGSELWQFRDTFMSGN